jgi:tRNA dimethylallyltransferase
MFRMGLVEETKGLLEKGLRQNQTALQALGYRQVVEHLDGERGLAETVELVKIRTRQFAKRQLTWFRRQMGLEWVTLEGDLSCMSLVEKILRDGFASKEKAEG